MFLLDTNIIVELELKQEKWQRCELLLKKIEIGEIEAVISDFAVDSIVLIMEHLGAGHSGIKAFLLSIANIKGLRFHEVSFNERIMAIDWMERYKLDYDDAIQITVMQSQGIKEIISLDSHFDRVAEIRRVEP